MGDRQYPDLASGVLQKDVSGGAGTAFAPASQLVDANGAPLGVAANPLVFSWVPPTLTDGIEFLSPQDLIALVVSGEAYVEPIALSTHIACLRATDSGSGSSAIIQADFTKLLSRATVGKGKTIKSFTVFWSLVTQALTGAPTATVETIAFAAPAAAAAAPTVVTTAGGSLTTAPASLQTAVPTANQFYGSQFILGTPLALNNALIRALAEITFPLGVSSVLYVAGVAVAFNDTPV